MKKAKYSGLHRVAPAVLGMAGALVYFQPSARRFLYAVAMNPTIILTAIGLYPLLLMILIRHKKLRYGLDDLTAAFLGFGATLVPFDYLSQKFGYPIREYTVFVLYIEVMIGLGFLNALKNRNLLQERAVALRWLIFETSLTAPATMLPAAFATVMLIVNNELFHNDWLALLAWLALVAPVLVSVWFWGIFNISKIDAVDAPRE